MKEILSETDDEGRYHQDHLVPGHYVVFASGRPVSAASTALVQEIIAPAYFPGVDEFSAAQLIELNPGQRFVADLPMHAE